MKKRTKKMRIKKINELFDDEDLKSRFEIPYLGGEMNKDVLGWKKIDTSEKSGFESLISNIRFNYPVINKFHQKLQNIDNNKVLSFYATSLEPIDGEEYYMQISFSYYMDDFFINVIMRNLKDLNMENWNIRAFKLNNLEDVKVIVSGFMKSCEHLNVIKPKDINNIYQN
jgi:hypothetical protein